MAQFNLDEYETVAERLVRAHEMYPGLRVVTKNLTTAQDRQTGIWVVQAEIFLDIDEQIAGCPKATGLAFEVDGGGGANRTAALENAETSAIGRCLANMNFSGDKKGDPKVRASREEMEKAQRGVTPGRAPVAVVIPDGFLTEIDAALDEATLKVLWDRADAGGFSAEVREAVLARKKTLNG